MNLNSFLQKNGLRKKKFNYLFKKYYIVIDYIRVKQKHYF